MYATLKPAYDSAVKRVARWAVLAPAMLQGEDRRIAIERRHRGREQYGKLRRADVVVVSFGKSGRTWLRVMLSRFYQVRHGLPESLLIGFDNFHLRNRTIPRIFFTHDNYTKDFTGNHDNKRDYEGKKVVLLVRHPADVAVSQFHQWKFRMRERKKSLNDYPDQDVTIFDFVAREKAGLDKVIDFMNLWAAEMEKVGQVFILRYEDMRAAPEATLESLLGFMGTPGTEEQIAEAVRFASFENMRKLEEKRSFFLAGSRMKARDVSNPESFKTRRGKVGGWRDYFTAEEADEIERLVDARLASAYGYTISEQVRPAEPALA